MIIIISLHEEHGFSSSSCSSLPRPRVCVNAANLNILLEIGLLEMALSAAAAGGFTTTLTTLTLCCLACSPLLHMPGSGEFRRHGSFWLGLRVLSLWSV